MASPNCVVVDYGIGNVFSVLRALERLDYAATLSSDRATILAADRLILPGVGAFGRAAEELRLRGLDVAIHDFVATGKPFLGICVGMQLLADTGEEFGTHKGLGIIAGTVRKIEAKEADGHPCRVPLIGWNPLVQSHPGAWTGTPFEVIGPEGAFYFVHSYEMQTQDPKSRVAEHSLGVNTITSAVRKDNVLGVQFHPERSAEVGQRFLDGFMR
jgi:glutamine amidotransferase